MVTQQAEGRLESAATRGGFRAFEMPPENQSVPVLQPAPPIPILRPADPTPEDGLREIRGLWTSIAIGVSFWLAFGVLIWASLR